MPKAYMCIRLMMPAKAFLAVGLVLGGTLFTAGCQSSKETIAPEAGKPLTAAEKADEAERAASGKM